MPEVESVSADPYRILPADRVGDVVPPRPRTYARHAMLDGEGKVVPIGPDPIPLDVWRYVLGEDGRPTGYVKRERMRSLGEVFADLHAALDLVQCETCGREWRREEGKYGVKCECGGGTVWFIDEYLSGPYGDRRPRDLVPHTFQSVACYPVTGGSEGHYVHVEFHSRAEKVRVHLAGDPSSVTREVSPVLGQGLVKVTRLALGKTFRGLGHASEIARRCAALLGA